MSWIFKQKESFLGGPTDNRDKQFRWQVFCFRRKLMLAREERRAVDFSVEASEAM